MEGKAMDKSNQQNAEGEGLRYSDSPSKVGMREAHHANNWYLRWCGQWSKSNCLVRGLQRNSPSQKTTNILSRRGCQERNQETRGSAAGNPHQEDWSHHWRRVHHTEGERGQDIKQQTNKQQQKQQKLPVRNHRPERGPQRGKYAENLSLTHDIF